MTHVTKSLKPLLDSLDPKSWSTQADQMAPHMQDWRGRYLGDSPLLFMPSTTQEVAQIVQACNEKGMAILPQSGNTGLVGGSTPQGEVILSLKRMNRVRKLDVANDSVTVDAGVILETLQGVAEDAHRLFPLSLGAQGSAMIGGLISTNAGGVHVLRYGMMRDLVLGLEIVLPSGEILSDLSGLRKNNTGYDLKQLFIGAEGTLGVITGATLKLFPRPADTSVAMVSVSNPHAAVDLLSHMKQATGGAVAAFELIPLTALELVLQHIPGARSPLDRLGPWTVLIELTTPRKGDAIPLMEASLADAFEADLLSDAVIAQSQAQLDEFWALRENIPEAEKAHGKAAKHDVSVPVSSMADFLNDAIALAESKIENVMVIAFGHVGDGNVHFNIAHETPGAGDDFIEMIAPVSSAIYDLVEQYDGSISAEHGIGILKQDELARRKPLDVRLMREIKTSLDPNNIMNPRILIGQTDD